VKNNNLVPILAAAGGAVVIVGAFLIAYLIGGGSSTVNPSNLKMVPSINAMLKGVPQQGDTLGNPDAKLTVVEFGDPRCTACMQFSESIFPNVVADYIRTGKIRFQFLGQMFFDNSYAGTTDSDSLLRLALAAGKQDKFWNVLEIIYANQGVESGGWATDGYMKAVATGAGLDGSKTLADSKSNVFTSVIKGYRKTFDSYGFDSTPSFMFEPTGKAPIKKMVGISSLQDFESTIQTELKKVS
jgi:protein-disulfide isomerase